MRGASGRSETSRQQLCKGAQRKEIKQKQHDQILLGRKDATDEDMRHHTIVINGVGTSACDEEVEDST